MYTRPGVSGGTGGRCSDTGVARRLTQGSPGAAAGDRKKNGEAELEVEKGKKMKAEEEEMNIEGG